MVDFLLLPEDIIEKILLKASVKTLIVCTAVCKFFDRLINSSRFIDLQQISPANNPNYLLCENITDYFKDKYRYYSLNYDTETFHEYCRLVFYKYNNQQCNKIVIHGCSNGLICYSESVYDHYIYIWNPAIHKLMEISTEPEELGSSKNNYYGFWFDANEKDFKIAKICIKNESSEVYVCSIATNSWKFITDGTPAASHESKVLYLNGTLHWLVRSSGDDWIVISLNLNDGKFRETLISWPTSKEVSCCCFRKLDDQSFVIFGGSNFDHRWIIVQVYDENLNKLYSMDLEDDDSHFPVGSRNNGEVLFLKSVKDNNKIVSCNPGTKKYKDFAKGSLLNMKIRASTGDRLITLKFEVRNIYPFVETLALLDYIDAIDTSQ